MGSFIVANCLLNVLLMVPSITGNVFVLVAILRSSSRRWSSTVFLCSLAVSDFLVVVVVQPFYVSEHQLNPGLRLKDAFDALSSLGCGVSLCTMTEISVDRFLALHYHMRYPNLMTDKRAMYISLDDPCIMYSVWNITYARLAFVPGIAICILVSTFLYISIYQIVRRHQLLIHIQQQAVKKF